MEQVIGNDGLNDGLKDGHDSMFFQINSYSFAVNVILLAVFSKQKNQVGKHFKKYRRSNLLLTVHALYDIFVDMRILEKLNITMVLI